MKRIFPILALLTGAFLSYALYLALEVAPTEQTMGDVQRIFYYHVPSAWTAFLLFFINLVASVLYLVRRIQSASRYLKRGGQSSLGLAYARGFQAGRSDG